MITVPVEQRLDGDGVAALRGDAGGDQRGPIQALPGNRLAGVAGQRLSSARVARPLPSRDGCKAFRSAQSSARPSRSAGRSRPIRCSGPPSRPAIRRRKPTYRGRRNTDSPLVIAIVRTCPAHG